MTAKIGDKVLKNGREGIGIISHIWANGTFNVTFSDGEYSLDSSSFVFLNPESEPNPSTRKVKTVNKNSIINLRAAKVPEGFIEYLKILPEKEIDIRIHYPEHVEKSVCELFIREGLVLPEGIRPINSGSRGGVTVQYGLAGEMWFPIPDNQSILPNRVTFQNGKAKISSLGVILTVLKNGFSITKFTGLNNG